MLEVVVKDSLDWLAAQVVKDVAVLFLIANNAIPTLMMLPQLYVVNALMDSSVAMVPVSHVLHYLIASPVLLVMPAFVVLEILGLIMVFASLDLHALLVTVTLVYQEMQQIAKGVILALLLLLMVHVNWMHARLVL